MRRSSENRKLSATRILRVGTRQWHLQFMASFLPADSRPGGPTIDPDLHEVANRVHEEFDDHVDPRVVDECLNQIAARFADATVHTFIPLLVRRYVREELQTRLGQP